MNILFIPYGTEKAPATRYRVTQWLGLLNENGIGWKVFSAISGFSTNHMINSSDFGPFSKVIYYLYISFERITRFLYITFIAKKFDIIFLQRTTFPLRLEKILQLINNKIIFDIDDAIYFPDRQENTIATRLKKYIKKREVMNILKVSKAVIVENEYIKDFVLQYCKDISKIPGPIDTDRFFVKSRKRQSAGDAVVIGWIGSPATTIYLHMLDPVFKDIQDRYRFVKFRFIGPGRYSNPDIKFEKIEWRYETEVAELQAFDIGIMPMPHNEWTKGKLGCKMLQYMAIGIPSVVSYTPANAEIIEDGINGFFARDEVEWAKTLSRLIENGALRSEVGARGRETVLKKCSLSANIGRYIDIFNNI